MHLETPQLPKVEVPDVIPPVAPAASRVAARNVGDPIKVDIVQYDERVIAGGDDILLQVVGAHRVGKGLGRQGMFGQVPGRASMSDHDWSHLLGHFN
jgi:hypothetical protein